MELILVSNRRNKTYSLPLGLVSVLSVGLLFLVMMAGIFYAGGRVAAYRAEVSHSELGEQKYSQWRWQLKNQQASVDAAKKNAKKSLDALSARLSTLQAHLLRLDALGSRLVKITDMSDIEFDMLESPGLGGPSLVKDQNSPGVTDFIAVLQAVGRKIEDRSEKLSAIESMLMDSNIQSQVLLEETPVVGGWISSAFGWRTDPISGKKDFHEGIDLAGKFGSKVTSAAAGIVTWSGWSSGYGNMIEINHGNGYVTRYAHNERNLVMVGDKIEKGQSIAVMGSTGRSTGPHVHFEVVHNGKHVNPGKFVSIH